MARDGIGVSGAASRGLPLAARMVLWLLGLLLMLAALCAGWIWHWLDSPLSLARPQVELSIESGASPVVPSTSS